MKVDSVVITEEQKMMAVLLEEKTGKEVRIDITPFYRTPFKAWRFLRFLFPKLKGKQTLISEYEMLWGVR